MRCWACKAVILATAIVLIALIVQAAVVIAAVINATEAIILAAGSIGLSLSPEMVFGSLSLIAGYWLNEIAAWLCCKMGVADCCKQ